MLKCGQSAASLLCLTISLALGGCVGGISYEEEYASDLGGNNLGELSQDAFTLSWTTNTEWEQGHCLDLTFRNGGRAVDYWTLVLQLDGTISDWGTNYGAEIATYDDRLVIEPTLGPLDYAEEVNFQYCAEPKLLPTAIVDLSYTPTNGTGDSTEIPGSTDDDPTPGPYSSLSDDPFTLLYRENGISRDEACTELQLTNRSNNTLEYWSIDLEFDSEAKPVDWWGDFTPVYWYGNKVELVPQSYKQSLAPYDTAVATLCMEGGPNLVQLTGDPGTTAEDSTGDPIELNVIQDQPLTLIFQEDGTSNGGSCLSLQVNNNSATPLETWSVALVLNRSASPTDFSGDFYPSYWSGNRLEMLPVAGRHQLDAFGQANATLCLSPESQPLSMTATVVEDTSDSGSNSDNETDGQWHSLRSAPLSLIYRLDGSSDGGSCVEMQLTNTGDTALSTWSASLQLDTNANPTDYWGDFAPTYWSGSVIDIQPLSHKEHLDPMESAHGTVCFSPTALPNSLQASTTEEDGTTATPPPPASSDGGTISVLEDSPIYLQYQQADTNGCWNLSLINGGQDDLLNWQGTLTLNREASPTEWSGDFMPLYWDNNTIYLSPVAGQDTLEPLEMLNGTLCLSPSAAPIAFDAQWVISESPDDGIPPVVTDPEDDSPATMTALMFAPLNLTFSQEEQSDGSHCLKMQLQNTEAATIDDWSIELILDKEAKPTTAWGDFLPVYWQGNRIEMNPASHKQSLAYNDSASATLCLYPQGVPVAFVADISFEGDGIDGSSNSAAFLIDGPLHLLYRQSGEGPNGDPCLGLELTNLGEKQILSWEAQLTFSSEVSPIDWWGELRPVQWEGTTLDLLPPSYAQSLDILSSATGTLCLDSTTLPQDLQVTVNFTDGGTYTGGQYVQAPSSDPLEDGPITLLFQEDGTTQGASCLGLTIINNEDYDLLSYSLALYMDKATTPMDWWGDLSVSDYSSNRILLVPVDYKPTLSAGEQITMTLCLSPDAMPESLQTEVELASSPGGGAPVIGDGVALIYTISGTSNGGTCLDLDLFNTTDTNISGYIADITMGGTVNVTDYWGATPLWQGDVLSLYPPAYNETLGPSETLQSTVCLSPLVLPELLSIRGTEAN